MLNKLHIYLQPMSLLGFFRFFFRLRNRRRGNRRRDAHRLFIYAGI